MDSTVVVFMIAVYKTYFITIRNTRTRVLIYIIIPMVINNNNRVANGNYSRYEAQNNALIVHNAMTI